MTAHSHTNSKLKEENALMSKQVVTLSLALAL
jgi:hypothetical protein